MKSVNKQISECSPSDGFAILYSLSQTHRKEEAQPEKDGLGFK